MLVGLLLLAAPAAEQPARRATTGLHPQDSESREVKELNGLWRFRPDPAGGGLAAEARWQEGLPEPVLQMPVPSSYNDITQDRSLRDLLGLVWYERDFFALCATVDPALTGSDRDALWAFANTACEACEAACTAACS